MLDAKWAPVVSAGSRITGFCGGVVLSRFSTLSPMTLLSVYPSRPFIQLYHAVSILPSLLSVLVWWLLMGKRPLVAIVGVIRVFFSTLAMYITAEDSFTRHGEFSALYVVVTLGWMWLISAKFRSPRQPLRRNISLAYLAVLFLFMHFQGQFLSGGHGYYKVICLRILQISLDLAFDLLAFHDFEGFLLYVDYSRVFEV